MPILSRLKRKAKNYFLDSLDNLQNEIESYNNQVRLYNNSLGIGISSTNSLSETNCQNFFCPNIQRSASNLNISLCVNNNYNQSSNDPSNRNTIQLYKYNRRNNNFIDINISEQPQNYRPRTTIGSNHNQSNNSTPRNFTRLIENDEMIARVLQDELNQDYIIRPRNRSLNNVNRSGHRNINQATNRQGLLNLRRISQGTQTNSRRTNQETQTNSNFFMNQNQNVRPQRELIRAENFITDEEFDKLSTFTFRKNFDQEENQCSICIEVFTRGDKLTYLKCFHKFHTGCIREWLKESRKCPLCKNDAIKG